MVDEIILNQEICFLYNLNIKSLQRMVNIVNYGQLSLCCFEIVEQ